MFAPKPDTEHIPTITIRLRQLMYEKTARDNRYNNPVTQEEIADAIGISRATMSAWSGGKVDRLDKTILARLCHYFQCEIGDLLYLEASK